MCKYLIFLCITQLAFRAVEIEAILNYPLTKLAFMAISFPTSQRSDPVSSRRTPDFPGTSPPSVATPGASQRLACNRESGGPSPTTACGFQYRERVTR